MPLMALAIVVLFGCAKEETTTAALSAENQQVEESTASIFRMNFDYPELGFEAVSLESLKSNSGSAASTRSNHPHTNGHYTSQNGNTLTFSAIQNNGGVHGQVTGTGEFFDIRMSSECIVVEGNQAVLSG